MSEISIELLIPGVLGRIHKVSLWQALHVLSQPARCVVCGEPCEVLFI